MTAISKTCRNPLLALPIVIVPVAFFVSLPWLKAVGSPLLVLVSAAAAAIFVTSYANYLTYRFQRRQDEVQRAGTGFAAQWGVAVGQAAFVLLLAVPPVLDLATVLVRNVLHDPHASEQVIIISITIGFGTLVFLQAIGTVVVRALWWRAKR